MPSPFPGMDPYLEGSRWTGFHSSFVSDLQREIAAKLPQNYVVLPEERLVVEVVDSAGEPLNRGELYPDVSVIRRRSKRKSRGGVATLEPPLRVETVSASLHPETFLEIRDIARQQLVTAIEVLSPTNKLTHRAEYLSKRDRLLASGVNLVEIDLLIGGRRLPMKTALPAAHSFVFVGRAQQHPATDVWPIPLKDSLPKIPIPLLPEDRDVVIDLQKVFTGVFDRNRYRVLLNYSQPPEISLPNCDLEWVRKQLRQVRP